MLLALYSEYPNVSASEGVDGGRIALANSLGAIHPTYWSNNFVGTFVAVSTIVPP